jgi:4-amino-4-deoxy-L-arabinose transferase-like glycosyltransferase
MPHAAPEDISRKAFVLILAVAGVLGLGLRLALTEKFQGLASPPSRDLGLDQIDYELFAHYLSVGEGYVTEPGMPTARRTPGTSLAIVPVYLVFGRSYLAARLWWCLLSAATPVAVGWLGAVAFSRACGAVAAVLTALYPGHFYYSMHFLSEVPFGLLMAIALGLLIIAARSGRLWPAVASGLLWGLAILARSQIAVLFPVLWAACILWPRFRKQWRVLAAATAAAGLAVAPWLLRNYLVFGKPTMSLLLSAYTFWGAHNDVVLREPALQGRWIGMDRLVDAEHPLVGTEVERDAAARRYGREWIRSHWRDMPWLTAMKVWRLVTPFEATGNRAVYWAFAVTWMVALPLVAAGIVLAARQRPEETLLLASPLLAALVATILFYGCIRFRDAVSPAFLIFAALPLARLWSQATLPTAKTG